VDAHSSGVEAFDNCRCIVASGLYTPVPLEAQSVFSAFEEQVATSIQTLKEIEEFRTSDSAMKEPSVLFFGYLAVIQINHPSDSLIGY
jgi:hypothetical protein